MKLLKKTIFFLFIIVSNFGIAQDMSKGFSNLEKGEFEKAEVFFENI